MKTDAGQEEKQVFAAYLAKHRLKRSEQREVILDTFADRRNGELWDAIAMGLVLDRTSPGSSFDAAENCPRNVENDYEHNQAP